MVSWFLTRVPRPLTEEKVVFLPVVQLDIHMQKNEAGPLPHTIYKKQLKVDQRSKHKSLNCKTIRRKHRDKSWI